MCGWRGTWILYENANLMMKLNLNKLRNVSSCYGISRIQKWWRWVEGMREVVWFAIRIANISTRDYYLQYTNFRSLRDKESVIVSPTINVHTLRKKGEIKTVPFCTRLHSSFVAWRSLNWLDGWGTTNIFRRDCWDSCKQK